MVVFLFPPESKALEALPLAQSRHHDGDHIGSPHQYHTGCQPVKDLRKHDISNIQIKHTRGFFKQPKQIYNSTL